MSGFQSVTIVRRVLLIIAAATSAAAAASIDGISFVDRGASGEINIGDIRGGFGVIDYDHDGWPDLVFSDTVGKPKRLFHNQPDPARPGRRTFVDTTIGSGINDANGAAHFCFGVVAVDYDNDGYADVFMSGTGGPGGSYGLLYHNAGNGTFTNVSAAAGIRGTGRTPECISATDYDLDGWVDLFYCFEDGPPFQLLHNNHDGTFTDMTSLLPSVPPASSIYAHLWMDYDQDGYQDCFVLINSNPPTLLKNVSDGSGGRKFINAAQSAGFTHLGPAPMGISAGDYDGDGHLDLAITDAVIGTYYRNLGTSLVEVKPFATFFGWGVAWLDVDNDGDLDNYYVGSHGNANLNRLTRNLGNGQWDNISAALNTTSLASQHSVQLDFNNDGRQDMVTINPGTPGHFVSVFENVSTTGNHWLLVKLEGNGITVNRDAIGARVRMTAGGVTQVREIICGSSTTSSEDLRLHFGLKQNTVVDSLEVVWPWRGALATRTVVYPGPIAVDQLLTIAAPPPVPADFDLDGDVDHDDFLHLQGCVTGPNLLLTVPDCQNADLDHDDDVDQADFGMLQRCISGTDRPISVDCAS